MNNNTVPYIYSSLENLSCGNSSHVQCSKVFTNVKNNLDFLVIGIIGLISVD